MDTQASLDNDKKGISVRNVSTEWANSLTTLFTVQIWGYMADRAVRLNDVTCLVAVKRLVNWAVN